MIAFAAALWLSLPARAQQPRKEPGPDSAAAAANDREKREVAQIMMNIAVKPMINLSVTIADQLNSYQCGRSWAVWETLDDLARRRAAGEPDPQPDERALEAAIRLETRSDSKRLTGRRSPEDVDFAAAAKDAAKALHAYAAKAGPKADLKGPYHAKKVFSIIEASRKRMVDHLPFGGESHAWGRDGDPVPLTPLERGYVDSHRVETNHCTVPPWPGGSRLRPLS